MSHNFSGNLQQFVHMYMHVYIDTVQLDLNFTNTRVCNSVRTTRVQKSSLRASMHTTG